MTMKTRKNKEDFPLEVEAVTDKVVYLSMETQKQIASALIRFQEYYESPIPEIKGQIFTLGFLRKMYSESPRSQRRGFTYFDGNTFEGDWSGFNFPGYILDPFIRGLFDPLTPAEQDIVDLFKDRSDKFYIIGGHRDTEETEDIIQHEICHALFYVDDKYQKQVLKALLKAEKKPKFKNFYKLLAHWGYAPSVFRDEAQAYICANWDWLYGEEQLEELSKFRIVIPEDLYDELASIKRKYFKPLDSKFEIKDD